MLLGNKASVTQTERYGILCILLKGDISVLVVVISVSDTLKNMGDFWGKMPKQTHNTSGIIPLNQAIDSKQVELTLVLPQLARRC